VLDFGPELSFALLERAFGGSGASAPPARALTPLEQKVIQGFGEKALAVLAQGWKDAIPAAPVIGAFQSTPDLLQALAPEEVVLVAAIEIRLGESRHLMTVSLPFSALRAYLDHAAAPRSQPVAADEGRERRARIEGRLRDVRITIAARLPKVWMSARAIAALAPGQVLHAAHAPDAPLEVQLNGTTRFHASLGQVRKQLALRIATVATTAPAHDRPEPIHKGRTK
jgi:flagellar motor switch protein FliM